jgi:hypothetical protein
MLCETGFQAEGELRLLGASVTGHLSFGDAVLVNPHERSLDLEGVVVGTLVLPTDTAPDGVVDLTDASVTRLIDNWPVTQYSARLGGLTYDSLRPLPTDPAARLRWLVSAADGYLPHPYQQLILALRRAGRDDDARAVAIARERRRREELGIASRGWSLFLGVTVGYGYQAWRGIIWLAAFALAGWPIFAWARAHHHMNALRAPTEPLPQFHAWLYSLDSVLPVVNLGQKDYWSPTGIAQVWHAASVLAGWFLVTLILGALTTRLVRD